MSMLNSRLAFCRTRMTSVWLKTWHVPRSSRNGRVRGSRYSSPRGKSDGLAVLATAESLT
jgi:hypothetical protein